MSMVPLVFVSIMTLCVMVFFTFIGMELRQGCDLHSGCFANYTDPNGMYIHSTCVCVIYMYMHNMYMYIHVLYVWPYFHQSAEYMNYKVETLALICMGDNMLDQMWMF